MFLSPLRKPLCFSFVAKVPPAVRAGQRPGLGFRVRGFHEAAALSELLKSSFLFTLTWGSYFFSVPGGPAPTISVRNLSDVDLSGSNVVVGYFRYYPLLVRVVPVRGVQPKDGRFPSVLPVVGLVLVSSILPIPCLPFRGQR